MAGVSIEACPAASGMDWLRRGLRLYASRPVPLFLLNTLGIFVGVSLGLAPWIGPTLFSLVYPMIQLGMLTACRTAAGGGAPGLASYRDALAVPATRLRLLQLGVVLALVTGLAGLVIGTDSTAPDSATAVHGEHAAPGAPAMPPPGVAPGSGAAPGAAAEVPPSPLRVLALVVTLLLLIPVHLAVVFATVLVGWHDQPSAKALFFGTFAVWRNRIALLLNILGLSALSLTGLFVGAAAFLLAGIADETARELLFPLLLLMLPIATASNFAMVHDIVHAQDADPGAEANGDDPDAAPTAPGKEPG
jgi:hypothetical protein